MENQNSGEPTPLDFGSLAPSLEGVEWVRGAEPTFEAGLTLVEFWATWCGPCVAGIPHLTALRQKYEGKLTIASVSSEDLDVVRPFVMEQGEQMGYAVGQAEESIYTRYMNGDQCNGIPHSFLFDERRRLLWQGHPMAVEPIISGLLGGSLSADNLEKIGHVRAMLAELENEQPRSEEQYYDLLRRKIAINAELDSLIPDGEALSLAIALAAQGDLLDEFTKLLERVDPARLSVEKATELALSLVRDPSPFMRAPTTALKLVAHVETSGPGPAERRGCARVYLQLGELDLAEALLRPLVQQSPQDQKLGWELASVDQHRRARATLRSAG